MENLFFNLKKYALKPWALASIGIFTLLFGYSLVTGQVPNFSVTADASTLISNKTEMCGNRAVNIENADAFPGHPKLSALLATQPCFNYGFLDQNRRWKGDTTHIVNVMNPDESYEWSQDIVSGAKAVRRVMQMNQLNQILSDAILDITENGIGKRTVANLERAIEAQMQKTQKPGQYLNDYDRACMFWKLFKEAAWKEGVRIELSDAVRERKAADKMPGDFLMAGGTADRYKVILAKMAPSNWEKFQMVGGFAGSAMDNGEIEEAVALRKQAINYLKDPKQIKLAVERTKKWPEKKLVNRILSELGLA